MDQETARQFNDGIKALQCLVGEAVTINQITYPCIVGIEHTETDLMEGGFKQTSHVGISINLTDITASPVLPAIGQPALLVQRGRTYRVSALQPTQTTWELDLIDLTT